MKRKIMLLLMILCFSMNAYTKEIRTTGIGKTEKAARKEALGRLSAYIRVEIKTNENLESEISKGKVKKDNFKQSISITSENKIYGVKFKDYPRLKSKEYKVDAYLDESSLEDFKKSLTMKKKEIIEMINESNKKLSLDSKITQVEIVLKKFNEYKKNEESYYLIEKLLSRKSSYKNIKFEKVKIILNGSSKMIPMEKVEIEAYLNLLKNLNSKKTVGLKLEDGFQDYDFLNGYLGYLKDIKENNFEIEKVKTANIVVSIQDFQIKEKKNQNYISGTVIIKSKSSNAILKNYNFKIDVSDKDKDSIELALLAEFQNGKTGNIIENVINKNFSKKR